MSAFLWASGEGNKCKGAQALFPTLLAIYISGVIAPFSCLQKQNKRFSCSFDTVCTCFTSFSPGKQSKYTHSLPNALIPVFQLPLCSKEFSTFEAFVKPFFINSPIDFFQDPKKNFSLLMDNSYLNHLFLSYQRLFYSPFPFKAFKSPILFI